MDHTFNPQPKEPRLDLPGLLAAARGAPCMFSIPSICNSDPSTTVACHSNLSRHGKGGARKAHDIFIAFGCSACHRWYDERTAIGAPIAGVDFSDPHQAFSERQFVWQRAHDRTLLYLVRTGVLILSQHPAPMVDAAMVDADG